MDLSIIIVSWNTRVLLRACLESVQRELSGSTRTAETLVIDNGSTDGSPEMLADQFPWVHLIRNTHNPGFAAANNQGIKSASGDLVLLLNSDTLLKGRSLDALLDFMASHPKAGAASARLLNADDSLQQSCYPAPTLFREFWRLLHLDRLFVFGRYDMDRWSTTEPREVDDIMGACMLLRRSTIDQVGLMDETYFMYSEEIDWCLRIRRAGWHIYWVPQAEIVHLGGGSTRQAQAEMFLYLYRGKILYFRKHHGKLAAWVYKLILLLASLPRLALGRLAGLLPGRDRQALRETAALYTRLIRKLPAL